jgi:DNA-binding CsgD family transcriptional regulator
VEPGHGENAEADAGAGPLPFPSPESDRSGQGPGPPGAWLAFHELATALARMMDLFPAELVLCTTGGTILHANPPARTRLGTGDGRRDVREEIRFLCVGLHLKIAEETGRDETENVFDAERRVTLEGGELHLRAVDLGVPRHGRSPAILVLLVSRDPLSNQELKERGLTRAEIGIAQLVVRGWTNREIARALSISIHTVRHHVQHIHDKMGVRSRAQLMESLQRHKERIVAPEPPADGAADGRHRQE